MTILIWLPNSWFRSQRRRRKKMSFSPKKIISSTRLVWTDTQGERFDCGTMNLFWCNKTSPASLPWSANIRAVRACGNSTKWQSPRVGTHGTQVLVLTLRVTSSEITTNITEQCDDSLVASSSSFLASTSHLKVSGNKRGHWRYNKERELA